MTGDTQDRTLVPVERKALPLLLRDQVVTVLRCEAEQHVIADAERIVLLAAEEIERLASSSTPMPVSGEVLNEAVEPWADFHGDLPDYDHPLRCVFESGVQYAVELLAKELGVENWDVCDGTEEFDGDLGGTLMNIVRASLPTDEHGEHLWPSEVAAALNPTPTSDQGEARAREVLGRVAAADGVKWDDGSDLGIISRATIVKAMLAFASTKPALPASVEASDPPVSD